MEKPEKEKTEIASHKEEPTVTDGHHHKNFPVEIFISNSPSNQDQTSGELPQLINGIKKEESGLGRIRICGPSTVPASPMK